MVLFCVRLGLSRSDGGEALKVYGPVTIQLTSWDMCRLLELGKDEEFEFTSARPMTDAHSSISGVEISGQIKAYVEVPDITVPKGETSGG